MNHVLANSTRRDRYLVIDLELTCWGGEPPDGMSNEIISVGIVEIDTRKREIIREGEYFIKPKWSEVSEYCTNLTGLTKKFIKENGRPFPEVMNSIKRDFGVGNKVWMAWGNDKNALVVDAKRHGVNMPFSPDYVNLAAIVGFAFGRNKRFGLKRALNAAGMRFEGQQHSALADAKNTAKLWLTISGAVKEAFQNDPPSPKM